MARLCKQCKHLVGSEGAVLSASGHQWVPSDRPGHPPGAYSLRPFADGAAEIVLALEWRDGDGLAIHWSDVVHSGRKSYCVVEMHFCSTSCLRSDVNARVDDLEKRILGDKRFDAPGGGSLPDMVRQLGKEKRATRRRRATASPHGR
jgi:hypothetical protein